MNYLFIWSTVSELKILTVGCSNTGITLTEKSTAAESLVAIGIQSARSYPQPASSALPRPCKCLLVSAEFIFFRQFIQASKYLSRNSLSDAAQLWRSLELRTENEGNFCFWSLGNFGFPIEWKFYVRTSRSRDVKLLTGSSQFPAVNKLSKNYAEADVESQQIA